MLTQEQARELTVRLHRRMNNDNNYRNQELGIMIPMDSDEVMQRVVQGVPDPLAAPRGPQAIAIAGIVAPAVAIADPWEVVGTCRVLTVPYQAGAALAINYNSDTGELVVVTGTEETSYDISAWAADPIQPTAALSATGDEVLITIEAIQDEDEDDWDEDEDCVEDPYRWR